jgi:hypothetical protein
MKRLTLLALFCLLSGCTFITEHRHFRAQPETQPTYELRSRAAGVQSMQWRTTSPERRNGDH